ncbi:MAG: 1-acyl-sn-glycerol-3-phosphate acyltransferase [Treponema sp.]|jgi:glycerol-3-phosphate O-acyltransferase|nr:1-acyl-sn-glycerol-3-phosphate acyltransferase [Treponema sp.]
MEVLSSVFKDIIKEAVVLSKTSDKIATVINEQNVYQIGETKILPFIDKMIDALILPGSGINGMEHLRALLDKAKAGASCLLLLEHYSNMDMPVFSYLLRKEPGGVEAANAVVAIAGMKLNEENPTVAVFTGAYTRLVIYPSRSLHHLPPEEASAETARYSAINHAAMRKLNEIKKQGKLILVFPSGTRYRPWDPSTKKGVREIDSYIKSFDYMCLIAINGELLHVRQGDMLDDLVSRNIVRFTVDPIVSCAEFRASARAKAENAGIEDKKQAVVDAIMARLDEIHRKVETEAVTDGLKATAIIAMSQDNSPMSQDNAPMSQDNDPMSQDNDPKYHHDPPYRLNGVRQGIIAKVVADEPEVVTKVLRCAFDASLMNISKE